MHTIKKVRDFHDRLAVQPTYRQSVPTMSVLVGGWVGGCPCLLGGGGGRR